MQPAELGRRGEREPAAQPSGRAARGFAQGLRRLIESCQHLASGHQILHAGIGEAHRPGGALEQRDAQIGFQPGDRSGDRGRRALGSPPDGGQAALLGRQGEGTKCRQPIHQSLRIRQ